MVGTGAETEDLSGVRDIGAHKDTQDSRSKERLERLRCLKAKRVEHEHFNKKELLKELRRQAANSRNYRMVLGDERIDSQVDENTTKLSEETEKLDVWSYTVEDCEKWEARKQEKANDAPEFQNFDKLAEVTYKKAIRNLPIDQEEYSKTAAGRRRIPETDVFEHKPGKKEKEFLSHSVKKSTSKNMRQKLKRNVEETDSYINKNNLHFNRKLTRQYGSKNE